MLIKMKRRVFYFIISWLALTMMLGGESARADRDSSHMVFLPLVLAPIQYVEMVFIPAGGFRMGCDPGNDTCKYWQLPLHWVYLSDYWIDRYEVTLGRYRACVQAGGCTPPQGIDSVTRPNYCEDLQYSGFPVINVDWFQAAAFCAWDGKRLPSEAEWEKAARGHLDTRVYPWGNRADSCDLLNFWGPDGYCVGDTVRVGSYPSGASIYGVMDMAGNVWEWVADWFDPAYYSAYPSAAWPSDPLGPASGDYKTVRSGSWDKDYYSVRSTRRQWSVPEGWDRSSGFRCARR